MKYEYEMPEKYKPSIEWLKTEVCKEYNLTHQELHESNRGGGRALARQVVMYILGICTDITMMYIPSIFGLDHSMAYHSRITCSNMAETDTEFFYFSVRLERDYRYLYGSQCRKHVSNAIKDQVFTIKKPIPKNITGGILIGATFAVR